LNNINYIIYRVFEIYPNGNIDKGGKDYISFYLNNRDNNNNTYQNVNTNYALYIRNKFDKNCFFVKCNF